MTPFYHGHIPETSGIYRITCIPTSKFYIGSAVNLYHRRVCHFNDLQHGTHRNSRLQRAWNKYGPDAFTFEVLELILIPFLLEREQYWFDKLQPFVKPLKREGLQDVGILPVQKPAPGLVSSTQGSCKTLNGMRAR